MTHTIFNPELLGIATHQVHKSAGLAAPATPLLTSAKQGFVDPMAAGAGGDPAAMGGMPPPTADPMAGAMPPMPAMGGDPMAGAMGPGGVEERLAKLEAMGAGGGEGGAMGEPGKKPKVDVNTEIYHIKKMLAKLLGSMGIQMDATDMLGDPAEDPEVPPEEAAQDPHSSASQQSTIGAIEPIGAASPALAAAGGGGGGGAPMPGGAPKAASVGLRTMTNKAGALAAVLRQAHANQNSA